MAGEMMEVHDHDLGAARQFDLVDGWYRGDPVTYYDFGGNSATNGAAVTTAPIFAFIHGMAADGSPRFVEGQHTIVDVGPGDEGSEERRVGEGVVSQCRTR